jgi:citronellol/citronellal dehydrogenase
MSLAGKTLFISGASRGIGLAIALRAAKDGANVVVAAKTSEPHRHLPGTIHTAAKEVEEAGGRALPLVVDVRDEASVQDAVEKAARTFGGIDICVNNASAISLTRTVETEMKRFDLMQNVNVRGTFAVSRACIPFLKRAKNPHVLNLSPPLNLDPKWLGAHVAYTISKYGMSFCALGMAEEFRADGIAFNGLWPISTIDTSAVRFVLGGDTLARASRTPRIMADAAYAIFNKPSRQFTGQLLLDEPFLRSEGEVDFGRYAADPATPLQPDLFVSETELAAVPTRFASGAGGEHC